MQAVTKALEATGLSEHGVIVTGFREIERGEKRSWPFAFNFTLRAKPGKDKDGSTRNRPGPISYRIEADPVYTKSATFSEWGYLIAELYDRDPLAHIGPYKNLDDFHKRTNSQYEYSSS